MIQKKSKNLSVFTNNFKNQQYFSKNYYQKILTHDLILKQNYTNIMQLPRLEKIICAHTSKNYIHDKKHIIFTIAALQLITGQKCQCTYAKKSIANFKIRERQIIGCRVVLRENLMYSFLDKLSAIVLPRIRDYKKKNVIQHPALQKQFTPSPYMVNFGQCFAYNFGINNLMLFPELENHFQLVENFRGMNCTFVISHPQSSRNRIFSQSKNRESSIDFLLLCSGFQIPLFLK